MSEHMWQDLNCDSEGYLIVREPLQVGVHNRLHYLVSGKGILVQPSNLEEALHYYEWSKKVMATPRETQFAGFAAALGAKIADTDGWNLADVETLIAQHAYDLVCHAAYELDRLRAFYHGYKDEVGSTPAQMIKGIPDLTVLPEPAEDSPDAPPITCAVCGAVYVEGAHGWYSYQDASGAKPETFAFCSKAHLNQWKKGRGDEQ